MELHEKAMEIIKEAEQALKGVLQNAAATGQYDCLGEVAEWAKLLARLQLPKVTAESPKTSFPPNNQRAKSKARKVYPKFCRDGDFLVKTAWSKASKSEYEHKASWEVVEALVSELKTASPRGRLVSMESILPIRTKSGDEIPGYQVYVGLAWLKDVGIVESVGRKGYALRKSSDIIAEVKTSFDQLSKRFS